MNLITCINRIRPGVKWDGNRVNGYNLETIAKTYKHKDPLPTIEECEAAWAEIIAEREIEAVNDSAKKDLSSIDAESIRSMREFITKKFADDPDLPEFLKTHEADAKEKRNLIK